MTLLLRDDDFARRSTVARGGLASLAASLAADLERVIERPLYVPETKAMLSREGGRCAKDGTLLDFDPFSPRSHQCPTCGTVYMGELHDLFWNYWYQLWLAERAVHGALLGALGVLPRGADFARSVLDAYCDLYPRYPNVDNALGPTRPFFSTYIESIWLLQLCVAADLLDRQEGNRQSVGRFKDVVVEPSRSLIASYDEGMSNRQVWNNAALMAASRVLERDDEAEALVWAESGLAGHLGNALLPDRTWYEGENYHLFAHRGLWYAVQICESAGFEVPADLLARYDHGFVTPLLTSLPDLTLPSRRDSQYAIPLRQWRFAEMCELGLARMDHRVLRGTLGRLYEPHVSHGETGRWKSTAEAERNLPPTGLTRADLGWKSLLVARETITTDDRGTLGSVLLDGQGIAVLRRDEDRVYVALDYGVSGGGHGHPDRLNLLLMNGERRILDDMGTGSYVDASLHWYRSTLAHNAPMFDGRSQWRVSGDLLAFEDRGAAGWISAKAPIAHDATVTRSVIVMPDYALDEVTWSATKGRVLDLPIHIDATVVEDSVGVAGTIPGSQQLEDGFRFLAETTRVKSIAANETVALVSADAELWLASDRPVELWSASAPGAPGRPAQRFLLVRTSAADGTIRTAWSWKKAVTSASLFPKPVIDLRAERHEHAAVPHGWQIAIHVGGAKSTIDLEGRVPDASAEAVEEMETETETFIETHVYGQPGDPNGIELGADAYRRSEQSWEEAGRPTARITFARGPGSLTIIADVDAERSFVPPGTRNRLDNEHADINGAGVQLYLRTDEGRAGYVIVPIADSSEVAIRPIDGWGADIPVIGAWRPSGKGYTLEMRIERVSDEVMLDLIINEKPIGRERRRGQLVLSGGNGEFVYLRGDRHDESRLISFVLE